MRVSEKLLYNQVTHNLQKNMERMLRIQTTLSSGKQIQKPSDDPIRNSQLLSYTTLVNKLEQYERNMDRGKGTLDLNDSTMSHVTNLIARAKELSVQMRSDTYSAEDRQIAAKETRQLLKEMAALANTRDGDTFLFSGDAVRGRYIGSAVSAPVVITTGVNDTLQVKVDGVTSGVVTLSAGSYASGAALATEIETKINADPALASNPVDVVYDSLRNKLSIVSQNYGENSSLDAVGGTARSSTGLIAGTSTSGNKVIALSTATMNGNRNTGTGSVDSGLVTDESHATLNDYVVKFTSASLYNVYSTTNRIVTADIGATASKASVLETSVTDTAAVTLDTYEIQFTGPLTYDVIDSTKGVTVSSGNSYASGGSIAFDGLEVVIQDGTSGGPVSGDKIQVSLNGKLISSANSYVSGASIRFEGLQVKISGSITTNDAFAVKTQYVFNGDSSEKQIRVGDNESANVGMSGGDVFTGLQGGVDLLATMKSFYHGLMSNSTSDLDTAILNMDSAFEQVVSKQAEVGARINYLDTTIENIEAFKANITALKSNIEDIDLVKVTSELLAQENAVQAARGATARVIQTSLLDFLR